VCLLLQDADPFEIFLRRSQEFDSQPRGETLRYIFEASSSLDYGQGKGLGPQLVRNALMFSISAFSHILHFRGGKTRTFARPWVHIDSGITSSAGSGAVAAPIQASGATDDFVY